MPRSRKEGEIEHERAFARLRSLRELFDDGISDPESGLAAEIGARLEELSRRDFTAGSAVRNLGEQDN